MRIPVLVFLALFVFGPLPAQQPAPATWRLEGGLTPSLIAEATARGYRALPASALVALGAQVWYEDGGVAVYAAASRITLRPGSAEAGVDGRAVAMANAVYEDGGVVFVPVEFFRDVLPAAAGGALAVDASAHTLRGDLKPARLAGGGSAGPATMASLDTTTRAAVTAEDVGAVPVRPAADEAGPPRRRLVVIDAGHGGRDPGARGAGGTREKDVTLAVARRLAAQLREDPTFEVRMTRDRDTLIALRDRARFANQWKDEGQPAVFISIHCNANPSRSAVGFETYFLSEARTADAKRVEEMENAAVQYEDDAEHGTPLDFIMHDLRQNQYLRESSDWAQMIQDRLRAVHPGPDRGVKQAGFAVLNHTFMPAVLVEIGFISNTGEERKLGDPEVQAGIARQLARAVRDFFARPAPARRTD